MTDPGEHVPDAPPPPPPPPAPPGPQGYQAYAPILPPNGAGQPAVPIMRVLARLIDAFITMCIGAMVALPFAVQTRGGSGLVGGLAAAALSIAYEVLMTANRGQTLGKMAVSIKVIRLDEQPLDLASAARRYSPAIVLALLGGIPFLGLIAFAGSMLLAIANLVMVFSARKSVYDVVGATSVVSTK